MSTIPSAIYLDHAATTPVRPEVAEAMSALLAEDFGNPSSGHAWGRRARGRLEAARASVAASLGVTSDRVLFTRGGTESDNLAVLGRIRHDLAAGITPHVVTSAVEHPAVLEAAERAVQEGGRHTVIGFRGGAFDLDALERTLRHDRPGLVSCMWVNNETGLVLPMVEIAALCRRYGAALHSDAVQAVGKLPVDWAEAPTDLFTITGHKIYGPKGTGALIARDFGALRPLHFGGGQERGLRPGTEDVAGASGLAEAVRLAVAEASAESARLEALRDAVESGLLARIPGARVNAESLPRAPHILSLGIPRADSDTLLAALDASGIAASGGSACASGSSGPTRTLAALYPGDTAAALRLSFGRLNRSRDAGQIVRAVTEAVERTRDLVPS
ncbi:MAG: cysteine desulfurase family protein [Gemmatimonadota bacterium]|nr:cysteine desulfurase family protein [Gemmatimonadota bacterium]